MVEIASAICDLWRTCRFYDKRSSKGHLDRKFINSELKKEKEEKKAEKKEKKPAAFIQHADPLKQESQQVSQLMTRLAHRKEERAAVQQFDGSLTGKDMC